jgi:type III restriction enzyme
VTRSHVNGVVPHSGWEKTAAYELDQHPDVDAFVKNAGLGFAIPYTHDGEPHDFLPDFIVRLKSGLHLVLETKGFDQRKEAKEAAAKRWVEAVNADGTKGRWAFVMVQKPTEIKAALNSIK